MKIEMKLVKSIKNNREIYFEGVFVYWAIGLFYLWLAAQIPYTIGDDFTWGLDIGISQLITGSINARYIGNLFVVIMTRSKFMKTLIMGGTMFLSPYIISQLAAKLCKRNSKYVRCLFFVIANIFLLSVPKLVWQETSGWVSGFANFGISAVFMLICFYAWAEILDDETRNNISQIQCVGYVMAAFCGQMFIENLSFAMTIASIVFVVVYRKKNKRHSGLCVAMAIACVLGLAVMFSSTIYKPLLETGSAVGGYRNIIIHPSRSISDVIFALLYQGAVLVIRFGEANTVLSSTVLLCMVLFFVYRTEVSITLKIIIVVSHTVLIVYFIVTNVMNIAYSTDNLGRAMIAAVLSTVYIIIISIDVLMLMKHNKQSGKRLVAVWCFALMLVAPLVIIDENGSRLFYTVIVAICLFVLLLINEIIGNSKRENIHAGFSVLKIALIFVCCLFIIAYSAIGKCNRERMAIIEEARGVNASSITLPIFPYQEYLYGPDPINAAGCELFKKFYGIPTNCDVIFE